MSAEDLSRWKDGYIRRNDCIEHFHLEWECDWRPLLDSQVRSVDSPLFSVGDQTYALSFDSCDRFRVFEIFLHLYRKGPSVDIPPIRMWAGLKCRDGTYHYQNGCGDLPDLEENLSMRKFQTLLNITRPDFHQLLTTDDQFTVFFQMEVASTNSKPCTHDAAEAIFPAKTGQIHDDEFACHKKVEWSVYDYRMQQGIWASPAFSVGEQHYRFLIIRKERNDFYLYRLGPRDLKPRLTFSAGLKRCDGIDHDNTMTGGLGFLDFFELWRVQKSLASFDDDTFTRYHLSKEGRLTFVFRMDDGAGEERCNHDISKNHWYHGYIEENECSSHKQVEWRGVDFLEVLRNHPSKWISPVFSIEGQYYALTVSYDDRSQDYFNLELLRKGPSVTGPPVRWWAGLKFRDGEYDYRNKFGKLKLEEKLSELTVVERLLTRRSDDLNLIRWVPGRPLSAFFQLEVEHESTTAEACTHGTPEIPYPFAGELRRSDCGSFKSVVWNVERRMVSAISRPFEIENQRYVLEFNSLFDDVVLNLYWKGPSRAVGDPVESLRWAARLKRRDGTDNKNESGDLKLEETFSMWTEAAQLLRISSSDFQRYFRGENGGFTAEFHLYVGQATIKE